MPKFANFVQCSLVASITAGATTIQVEAQAPYNLPADPGGQTAYITLMDNLNAPTRFEIVGYTGVTTIDATSLELTGCIRAQQGTTAQSWEAGQFARQDVTAANLSVVDLSDILIYAGSADTTVRRIQYNGAGDAFMTNHQAEVTGVVVAADGTVYSTDSSGQIIATDRNGEVLATRVLSGFNASAVTSKFLIGQLDSGDDLVLINRSDLTTQKQFSTGTYDTDVAVDGHGNIYAGLNDSAYYIVKYNSDGDEVWRVTDALINSRPGQLKWVKERRSVLFRVTGDLLWTSDILEIEHNGLNLTVVLDDIKNGNLSSTGFPVLEAANGTYIWTHSGVMDFQIYDYAGNVQFTVALGGTGTYAKTEVEFIDNQFAVVSEAGGSFQVGDATINSVFRLVDFTSDTNIWIFEDALANFVSFGLFNPRGSVVFADGFEYKFGQPDYENLANIPASVNQQTFENMTPPSTPPAGKCYVYLDAADGAFKVKFSNGVVKTIATP